jgi:putative hemolysin
LGRYHETLSFILIIGSITYLSVVIGELVPKRLAISNPEGIASLVAPFMNALLKVAMPIVQALSSSSEVFLRLLGVKQASSSSISDEEIRLLMGEGTRVGVFTTVEKKLVDRVLHLDDMQINSLMTPRASIQWFDINKLAKDLPAHLGKYKHSRIIVCDKTLNNLIGVIHVKDFLRYYLSNPKVDIKKHLEKPHLLPEGTQVIKVLELFRKSPMHLALIVDEHGSIQGLVTFNDVLEVIVGDIETREWVEKMKITKRPDNSYLVDGMVTTKELMDALKIEKLPKQAAGHVTLGGFIMAYLDKVPQEGDKFEWDGYRFEVVDMDRNRVDKVLITLLPEGAK